jgi:hypothetical protein
MNAAFELKAGATATLMCKGKTKGFTKVTVDSGDSAPTCAATIADQSGTEQRKGAGELRPFYHIIDIEIVP